jgi:hypothetical protein
MDREDMSIEGETQAANHGSVLQRDVFLELWAAEMLLRKRAAKVARRVASAARRLGQSESFVANARGAIMLLGVFVLVSAMIATLEEIMSAWRAALVTSAVLATLGLSLLQQRWVAATVVAFREARRELARRDVARVRVGTR